MIYVELLYWRQDDEDEVEAPLYKAWSGLGWGENLWNLAHPCCDDRAELSAAVPHIVKSTISQIPDFRGQH